MKKRVSHKGCLAAQGLRHLASRIHHRNGEITSYVLNHTQNRAKNSWFCFELEKMHESGEKSAQSGN